MLAKQAREMKAPECGANMLLLVARRSAVVTRVVFFGPDI